MSLMPLNFIPFKRAISFLQKKKRSYELKVILMSTCKRYHLNVRIIMIEGKGLNVRNDISLAQKRPLQCHLENFLILALFLPHIGSTI
jgi:hypothetical protein